MLRRAFHQTIKMPRSRRVRKARPHTKRISATVSTFLIDAYVTHNLALQPCDFAAVLYTILRISLVGRNYQWSLACIFRLHLQPSAVSRQWSLARNFGPSLVSWAWSRHPPVAFGYVSISPRSPSSKPLLNCIFGPAPRLPRWYPPCSFLTSMCIR